MTQVSMSTAGMQGQCGNWERSHCGLALMTSNYATRQARQFSRKRSMCLPARRLSLQPNWAIDASALDEGPDRCSDPAFNHPAKRQFTRDQTGNIQDTEHATRDRASAQNQPCNVG